LANAGRDVTFLVRPRRAARLRERGLEDMAPAVGPSSMIIPVLNGMKHLDTLAARFGRQRILGGAAKVAATIDREGRIVQLAPFQDLAYGELDGSRSARIEELDRFMQGAGFDARLSCDFMHEMWDKWRCSRRSVELHASCAAISATSAPRRVGRSFCRASSRK
jgi:2-dehydropantoate 2-reductase